MVTTLAVGPVESRVADAVAAGTLPVASADLTPFHPAVVVTHGARRMALADHGAHGAMAAPPPDVASVADETGLEIGLVLSGEVTMVCLVFMIHVKRNLNSVQKI